MTDKDKKAEALMKTAAKKSSGTREDRRRCRKRRNGTPPEERGGAPVDGRCDGEGSKADVHRRERRRDL